jgi:hypothetical protein
MRHWHLAYNGHTKYRASDLDCTVPYWHKDQVRAALSTHNINCHCRHVTIEECDDLMCIVEMMV